MHLDFWWKHARLPLVLFLLLAILLGTTSIDVGIARTFFFDAVQTRWIGAGNAWIEQGIHTGGRWTVRALVALALVVWARGINPSWRDLQRPAGYFALSTVLALGLVGLLKQLTHVHCPWDLTLFGGRYSYAHLFAARPDRLHAGHCFPAAHASSGYALFALYFVFRERSAALARWGLMVGICVGLVFGLAQQARGAHFASHDVWSAFVCWMVALTTYTWAFDAQVWNRTSESSERAQSGPWPREASGAARQLVSGSSVDL